MGQSFRQHRWENRLILIYAGQEADRELEAARARLQASGEGLEDRDLLIYIFRPGVGFGPEGQPLSSPVVKDFLDDYRPEEEGLEWILIGKDGGEKMRGRNELPLEEIFARIDQMPMRRREMREDQGGPR